MAEGLEAAAPYAGNGPAIPDQRLALMFTCAHPAIESGIRAPLILQAVLGLDAKAIASAFLTSPDAMGKRLVRAKDKIRRGRHPVRRSRAEELPDAPWRCAGRHLRCFRGGLDRRRWHRYRPTRPHGRSDVSGQRSSPICCLATRSVRSARPNAARGGAPSRATCIQTANTCPSPSKILRFGTRNDRRSRGDACLAQARWNSSVAISSRRAIQSAHVSRRRTGRAQLGGSACSLYDALLALSGSPGGRHQSRAGARGD